MLHGLNSIAGPVQFLPPCKGIGLLHSRYRVCSPPPQTSEHPVQSVHMDHAPSTTVMVIKTHNHQLWKMISGNWIYLNIFPESFVGAFISDCRQHQGGHYHDFDNGDGKDNVKKYNTIYIRFGKQKFSEENSTFWYISMPSLHNYDVNFSDATL